MPQGNETTTKFKVDISDLKKGMQEAVRNIRLANSEFKAATSGMQDWSKNADGLTAKLNQLDSVLLQEKNKLAILEEQYRQVAAEQGENSKAAQELLIKINNQKAAVGKTEAQLRTYQQKLSDVKSENEKLSDSTEEVVSASDKLKSTINDQETELGQLKKAYADVVLEQGKNSQEAKSLASDIGKLSSELQQNRSKLSETEKAADDLDESLDEAGDSAQKAEGGFTVLKGALADLAADGIRAVIDGLKDLITSADDAYTNFQAQTGASAEEMSKFKDEINDLYKQNFGESLQDIADCMAQVKQQTGEVDPSKLKELTKNAIGLRDTFGMDIQESMRATNRLMDTFGMSGEEAFNLIVQGAQEGLNQNDNLLDTINEYGPKFQGMGMSAQNMFNMLKNGADAGVFDIDKLGDAINEFTIRVIDGSETTKQGFDTIGLNADEMAQKFAAGGDTAKEAFQQTMDGLNSIEDPVARNTAAVNLFGSMWEDTGGTSILAMGEITGGIDQTKNSMQELNDVKYSDVGSQFTEIGRIIKTDFLMPLAQEAIPKIKEFVDVIKARLPEIKQVFNDVFEKVKEGFKWILDNKDLIIAGISGIAAAFAIIKIGALVASIAKFVTVVQGATKIWAGLKIALAAIGGPVTLIVAAIAGLVTAFVVLWNKSEAFRSFWIGLWEKIKSAMSTAVNAIIKFFKVTIPNAWNNFISFLSGFITKIVSFFSALPGRIWTFLVETVTKVGTWVSNMVAKAIEVGTQFITNVISFFQELPYNIGYFLGTVIGTVASWVSNMVTKAIEVGTQFLFNVVQFFQQLPGKVLTFITNTINNVTTWVSNMIAKAREVGSNFINNVVNFFQQLPGKVSMYITNTLSNVKTWVTDMINKAKEAGSNFLNNVVDFIKQLPGKIKEFLNEIIDKLKAWVSDMGTKGTEGAKKLFNAVVDGLKELPDKMLSIGSDIVSGVWEGISGAAGWLRDKVVGFGKGIIDGLKASIQSNSPSKRARDEVGKWIPYGIAEGIRQYADVAIRAAGDLADKLIVPVDPALPKMGNLRNRVGYSAAGAYYSGVTGNKGGTVVYQTFNQYNTSPKSLSRLDIYRQTRNQLNFAKGV